jgi:alkanesulfonate monooxygenase SsuD/methylene tetrahydromethanopterin reductase-like flavin-dependent oxidoreductase (luciferase family)
MERLSTTHERCEIVATSATADDLAGGGSDRLIDALVLHGSTDTVAAGLRAHLDAGADHVAIQVLTAGGQDPIPAYHQLANALL